MSTVFNSSICLRGCECFCTYLFLLFFMTEIGSNIEFKLLLMLKYIIYHCCLRKLFNISFLPPAAIILPLHMSKTWSNISNYSNLCVIPITDLSYNEIKCTFIYYSRVRLIRTAYYLSKFPVHSSNITILLFYSIVLNMTISCFSPKDKLEPFDSIG